MTFTLRPKQIEAVDAIVDFMMDGRRKNGIAIEPTAFGKSLLLANVAPRLDGPSLVLQPSLEILKQNKSKFEEYGYFPAVFSAAAGRKDIGPITLAMIGSVVKYPHLFDDFPNLFIDECHYVNSKEGVYKKFLDALGQRKICGLSATPWRLSHNSYGAIARSLMRSKQKTFHEVIHFTQISEMIEAGHWAKLEYYSVKGMDRSKVEMNSAGEYDDRSVQQHLFEIQFKENLADVVLRLLNKGKRRNVLVFTQFIPESAHLVDVLVRSGVKAALVTGDTPKAERIAIAQRFQSGAITVVANAKVWVHGFDFPRLECIVDAALTSSLSRDYQKKGRGVRVVDPIRDPHWTKKSCWLIDMVQSLETFGKLADLKLYCEGERLWSFWGKPGGGEEQQLTDIYFGDRGGMKCQKCGAPVQYVYNEATGYSAPLVRPTNGMAPNCALVQVDGKQKYRLYSAKRPRLEGEPEPTHVNHHAVCRPGARQ